MATEQIANIKFVEEVKKHPCLYNYEMIEYSRKDVTERAWEDVGKAVRLTAYQCKEKWKNLRAVFVRHMKPGAKTKKPYYLSPAMRFVLPYIRTLNSTNSGSPSKQEEVHIPRYYSPSQSPQPISLSPSPQPQSFPPTSPISSASSHSPLPSKKDFHKLRGSSDIEECLLDYFRAKKRKAEASDDVQDANKMFLLSLLPDVNRMTDQQMRAFKLKVLYLVDDILKESSSTST